MTIPNISDGYVLEKRKEIGAKLRSIREGKGLTQEQVGNDLSISKTTVSKIEDGKYNFGVETLIKFSVVLNFEIDLFLK